MTLPISLIHWKINGIAIILPEPLDLLVLVELDAEEICLDPKVVEDDRIDEVRLAEVVILLLLEATLEDDKVDDEAIDEDELLLSSSSSSSS